MVDSDPGSAFGCSRRLIWAGHVAGQQGSRAGPLAELRFVGGMQVGPAVSATGSGTSIITIEIIASDRAFDSWGCGTWTRVGD